MSEKSPALRLFVSSGAVWGLAVFAFALVLRLIGLGWGLPNDIRNQSLHPDEPIIWMYSQKIEPTRLDFDPGFYNYGTLYLTLLRVTTDVVQGYGGGPADKSEKAQWDAIGRYHKAGRLLSACAGAGIAWGVFAILRRRTTLIGAAAGGLAAAVAPGMVMHSRFQTVDMVAAFFLTLSLFYSLCLFPDGESEEIKPLKMAILAGLFAGLSAGTKYTGFLALLPLFIGVFYRPKAERLKLVGAGVGISILAFLITTPGAVLNSSKFLEDTLFEMRHTATGHGLVFAGTSPGFIYHIANLSAGMGVILLLVGCSGLGAGILRKRAWLLALIAFSLAYYVLIGRAEVKFFRYVIPLIPVLAVGVGWFIGQCQRSPNPRWRWGVAAGIIGLGGALSQASINTWWMASEDPRDQAARYLKEKAPNAVVGVVSDPWFQTPPLYPDTAFPRSIPFAQRNAARLAATAPRVVQYIPENPDERSDWDVRLLDEDKPEYVVYSSFEIDDVARIYGLPGLEPVQKLLSDRAKTFVDKLKAEYEPLPYYGADGPTIHDLMYVRPRIWIWKRKAAS